MPYAIATYGTATISPGQRVHQGGSRRLDVRTAVMMWVDSSVGYLAPKRAVKPLSISQSRHVQIKNMQATLTMDGIRCGRGGQPVIARFTFESAGNTYREIATRKKPSVAASRQAVVDQPSFRAPMKPIVMPPK